MGNGEDDDLMAEQGDEPRQPHFSIGTSRGSPPDRAGTKGPQQLLRLTSRSGADTFLTRVEPHESHFACLSEDVPLRAVGGSESIYRADSITSAQGLKSGGSIGSGSNAGYEPGGGDAEHVSRNLYAPQRDLPPFDASNGLLNARQHFGAAHAMRWEAHRKTVFSEMNIHVRELLWSFLIEILPVFVSGPMVVLFSGREEAKNRVLITDRESAQPYQRSLVVFLVLDALFLPSRLYICLGLFLLARDVLPLDAVYELVSVAVFVFGRAACVGIKYACYPDFLISDTSDSLSIHNKGYASGDIMDKLQMKTYILNVTGWQKIQLCNLLYKSCLYLDTDLSAAFFNIETCPTSMTIETQVTALEMWKHCLDELAEVYTSDPTELPEGEEELSPEEDLPRIFSLSPLRNNHCTGLNGQITSDAPELSEVIVEGLSKDDSIEGSMQRGGAKRLSEEHQKVDPGKQVEHLEDGVMLATFFRSRNRDITALAKQDKIPATVVALNLVFKSFGRTKEQGNRVIMALFLVSIVIGYLPPILRAMLGKSAFGDTPREVAFRAWTCWAQAVGILTIFFFNVAPCLWYASKLKLARELHAMLGGMDDSYTCGGNVKVVWTPQSKEEGPGFQVNMRSCEDVAAWAVLRQVLHGGNFGPVIHRKFQMYGVVMFGMFLAMPTVQALGSFYTDPGDGTKVIHVDVKILSILRMLLLAVPILVQVRIAYTVNQYTGYQVQAIFRMQRANMALSASLRGRGVDAEEQADKLDRCQALLGSVADEIRSSEDSSPMRVLGLVANPGVVVSIVSILTSIMVLEVRELGIVPFLS